MTSKAPLDELRRPRESPDCDWAAELPLDDALRYKLLVLRLWQLRKERQRVAELLGQTPASEGPPA